MKLLLSLIVLFIAADGNCQDIKMAFVKVKSEAYKDYKINDTLIHKPTYIVLTGTDPNAGYMTDVTVIEKMEGNKIVHYKLDPDAHFENDSTIIYFASPLKSETGKNTYEEGLWFYAEPYNEKMKDVDNSTNTRFVTDTIPKQGKNLVKPNIPGIYYFKNDSLDRVSFDQTERSFHKVGKSGFYFLPNPGRFYIRFSVKSIK